MWIGKTAVHETVELWIKVITRDSYINICQSVFQENIEEQRLSCWCNEGEISGVTLAKWIMGEHKVIFWESQETDDYKACERLISSVWLNH